MINGKKPLSRAQAAKFGVNVKGKVESIWKPLYHYQAYPAAGSTQLTFFQATVGGAGLTRRETNMEANGQLPSPKEMLITSIEVLFFPAGPLSAAAGVDTFANDNFLVGACNTAGATGGFLEFFIGSKTYVSDGPLMMFAPQFRLAGMADHGTGAFSTTYSTFAGKPYEITPIKLESNQNFNVTLNFPALTAISAAAQIGVRLNGYEYRLSQ